MKQEIRDIAWQLVTGTAPAAGISWWSQIHWTSVLAGLFLVLQICYLIRKWVREETEWGRRIKRWGNGEPTEPGDL